MIDATPYVPSVLLDWQRRASDRTSWVEDGALAFLDVSGFTAMSERLGRLGREGAEVVTDVIGSTFEELLAVAYEAGGSLLKFGGDALLLWFGGAGALDGARRACSSAARVRAALRAMGAVPTPMGGLRIRLSAGVHAGRFHFFLVGTAGRELVVTGPAATRTVEMEGAASAGQVLVSPETVDLLGRRWFGDVRGPGVLLRLPPPIGERVTPARPDDTGVDVPMLLSTAVRRHLAEGIDEAEHRPVTVGFVKFAGIDELLARGDGAGADETAARLHELVSTVQAACDEHEVALLNTDIEKDGGKFLLSAGAPLAVGHEDDRMLRALRAIVTADVGLPVRAGAHRGLVFAGSVGPFYRRSYTLMGDVVNTGARVMAHAEPGQVLATAEVLDRARSRFATRALPPFSAKGKSRPLYTWSVGAPQATADQAAGGGVFVGRDREVARLLDLLTDARERRGGAVEIVGEAGIGKSRLVREVSRGATGMGVAGVVVRGDPYGGSTPYAPFRSLLRGLLRLDEDADVAAVRDGLAKLAPALAADTPLVAAALGLDHGDESGEVAGFDRQVWRSRLHGAVHEVLATAFHRPLLLVVEDAQWLDEPSAELVRHLARVARNQTWLVLSARRSDEGAPPAEAVTTIELAPLDPADAAKLVEERASYPLLPRQSADIVQQGGGNPLFLEQLATSFDPDADEVPEQLEALVAARIDRLPAGPRSRLRQLAVLGPEFDIHDAGVVLDRPLLSADDLTGPLEEFLELGDTSASFRQHVFQSVAYAGLSYRRRRELHERIALHAEERGAGTVDAAKLAKHFDLADRFDRSWKYGVRAADSAYVQHAYPEAAALYRLALRAASRVEPADHELRKAWQGLGSALKFMGRQQDAIGPYRKARALAAGDALAEAKLCMHEGDLRQRLGGLPAAVRWFNRGLHLIERVPDDQREARWVRLRLKMSLGKVRVDQGRYYDAIDVLREALVQADADGDRPAIAHSLLWLSYALVPVDGEGYMEAAERALGLYEELNAAHWAAAALNGLAWSCNRAGRWSEAIELYHRALTKLNDMGDPMAVAVVSFNVGDLLAQQGKRDEASALLGSAARTFEVAGHAYAAVANASIARVAMQSGDRDQAEVLYTDSVARLRAAGLTAFVRETEVHWAEGRILAGDVQGAAELMAASPPGIDLVVEANAARVRGLIACARGDEEEARRELAASLAQARAVGNDFTAALAVVMADRLGLDSLAPDFDLIEAELILARLGVVTTPEPVVRNRDVLARRELCTKQSS